MQTDNVSINRSSPSGDVEAANRTHIVMEDDEEEEVSIAAENIEVLFLCACSLLSLNEVFSLAHLLLSFSFAILSEFGL